MGFSPGPRALGGPALAGCAFVKKREEKEKRKREKERERKKGEKGRKKQSDEGRKKQSDEERKERIKERRNTFISKLPWCSRLELFGVPRGYCRDLYFLGPLNYQSVGITGIRGPWEEM